MNRMIIPESVRFEDDRSVLRADALIHFGQCDRYGRIKLSELLMMLTDLAGLDFTARGMSYDLLQSRDIAFLVSRTAVRFHRAIERDTPVAVRTWERGSRGAQFLRCYEVCDRDGLLLASGRSSWTAVSPSARRILRPTSLRFEGRRISERETDCPDCEKLALPEALADAGEHTVSFCELDSNGHMNNARYSDVVFNALPPELRQRPLRDYSINYVHETTEGDTISVKLARPSEDSAGVYGFTERGVCFKAELGFGI